MVTKLDHGDVIQDNDGGCPYTPPNGFVGIDSYEFVVNDSNGNSDTVTVTIDVKQTNIPSLIIPGGTEVIMIRGENRTVKIVSSDCRREHFSNCTGVETDSEHVLEGFDFGNN